jgi:K+-sensing histidine kinase KdpD
MKFFITNADSKVLVSSIEDKCKPCIDSCTTNCNNLICPIYNEERRFGVEKMKDKQIFLCTTKKASKTTALFKEKIKTLAYSIPSIEAIKEDITIKAKTSEKNKYSKIVHNLRTLNAQSIQSQYKFIPQSSFADNHSTLYEFVKDEILQRIDEATISFLRLAKNNAHMKTEFTTHEKLSVESPNLSIQFHKVRSVILNVYHSFNIDFSDKNVRLKINENDVFVEVDYDTIRVAFYHIFLNAIKFIRPDTDVNVEIHSEDEYIYVDFNMNSLHINANEKEKIFEDEYSGENAIKSDTNGSGLGMGLIRKALLINKANIEVINGKAKNKYKGQLYSINVFRLKFNAV